MVNVVLGIVPAREESLLIAAAALRLRSDDVAAEACSLETDAAESIVTMWSCTSDLSRDDKSRVTVNITAAIVLNIH